VLIVDDHRAVAEALQQVIAERAEIRSAGVARNVDDALHMLAEQPCDVVLIDVSLPGVDGIEGTRRILAAHPQTRVVVITGHLEPAVLAAAVAAGASAFLAKDGPLTDVVQAVLAPPEAPLFVGTGTPVGVVAEAMRLRDRAAHLPAPSSLTAREVQVLGLLAEGHSPAATAADLGISLHTCRGHIKSVLAKLQVHSQLEAVVVAWQRGLIRRPGPR